MIRYIVLFFIISIYIPFSLSADLPSSLRSLKAISSVKPQLKIQLATKNLKYGSPIFIRIFKKSAELEVWIKGNSEEFELFKTYNICTFSGKLGPKLQQGDNQSPEGFYYVNPNRLNPWSSYHLSFNLGYPNSYDRYHGRTGSALMVHGKCVSIGCYAMTDPHINEIYALASAALSGGQAYFRVHSFPFRLNSKKLEQYKLNEWYPFWLNLKQGFDYFEENKRPPNVKVLEGRYIFN